MTTTVRPTRSGWSRWSRSCSRRRDPRRAALAPLIIAAYAQPQNRHRRALAVTFARYFLPQLLFYGIGATFGAILNVRGSFAAPMWAPVINNVVVIATGIAFILITHVAPRRVTSPTISC